MAFPFSEFVIILYLSTTYRVFGTESRRSSRLAPDELVLRSDSESSNCAASPPTTESRSPSRTPPPDHQAQMTTQNTNSYLSVAADGDSSPLSQPPPQVQAGALSTPGGNSQAPTQYNNTFPAGGPIGPSQPQNLYGPTYFTNQQWQAGYQQQAMPSHQQLMAHWQATHRNNKRFSKKENTQTAYYFETQPWETDFFLV